MERFQYYCIDCGWETGIDENGSRERVGERAIEHHCEHGHRIESVEVSVGSSRHRPNVR